MPLNYDAYLNVGLPSEVFGTVQRPADAIVWDLVRYLESQSSDYQGWAEDIGGDFVTTAPSDIWQDVYPAGTGAVGTYAPGKNPVTGAKTLRQTNPTGATSAPVGPTRLDEEGFTARVWVGGTTSASANFFLEFNHGHASDATGYRLAVERGQPLRLQSDASGSWADIDTARGLGEAETYLSRPDVGRWLTVECQPQTDASWFAGGSAALAHSGPPPCRVMVSVNGRDAVLTAPALTFPAGTLFVSATDRQWAAEVALRRYAIAPTLALPEQVRPQPFATSPAARLSGYLPYGVTATPVIIETDVNKAAATLSLSATADATGLSPFTPFLRSLAADYPSLQIAPVESPSYTTYGSPDLVYVEVFHDFDPGTRIERKRALCVFSNNGGAFDPNATSGSGGVHLAARAARLYISRDSVTYTVQITGWTALAKDLGQGWEWVDGQNFFAVWISDRFCKGDPGQKGVGYTLAYDRQPSKFIVRDLCNRMGITDDWLTFALLERDGDYAGEYYIPGSDTSEPSFQYHPSMPPMNAVAQVSGLSSELSSPSGQLLPMVFQQDPLGNVGYYGLPVGLVGAYMGSGPAYDFSGIPAGNHYSAAPGFDGDGNPLYNEILDGGLRTNSDLTSIRTAGVFEGINPQTGDVIVGYFHNPALGSDPAADPTKPGYVGDDVTFYDISRYVIDPDEAQVLADTAEAQMSFPQISTSLRLHLQPDLFPLMPLTVTDARTQGTSGEVGYWSVSVHHVIDLRGLESSGQTTVAARLLGEA